MINLSRVSTNTLIAELQNRAKNGEEISILPSSFEGFTISISDNYVEYVYQFKIPDYYSIANVAVKIAETFDIEVPVGKIRTVNNENIDSEY